MEAVIPRIGFADLFVSISPFVRGRVEERAPEVEDDGLHREAELPVPVSWTVTALPPPGPGAGHLGFRPSVWMVKVECTCPVA